MTTAIVPVPPLVAAAAFPTTADRHAGTYNAKSKAWADSENVMAESVLAIAEATKTNATAAKEQAQASATSATEAAGSATQATTNGAAQVTLATTQADLAMGYRNTTGAHAATASDKAAQAAGDAAAALGYRNTAQTAAGNAATEANRSRDEADRAKAAADSISSGPVTSVNGKTGVAVLAATDIAPAATAAEMQAGSEAGYRSMSPALVAQAIAALAKQKIVRSARASNVMLAAADIGKLIDITGGTFTQTFAATATLGDGWFCYIRNSGTGDITLDPNASEQIDGLTSYVMYPGEVRLVQSDGTALGTILVRGNPIFIAIQEKPTGNDGDYIGGSVWTTVNFNNVVKNTIYGASLAGNIFTVPAGKYVISSRVPVGSYGVITRIYNVTTSQMLNIGSSARASVNGSAYSFVNTEVLFQTATQLRLDAIANTDVLLGNAISIVGISEVYSEIIIRSV